MEFSSQHWVRFSENTYKVSFAKCGNFTKIIRTQDLAVRSQLMTTAPTCCPVPKKTCRACVKITAQKVKKEAAVYCFRPGISENYPNKSNWRKLSVAPGASPYSTRSTSRDHLVLPNTNIYSQIIGLESLTQLVGVGVWESETKASLPGLCFCPDEYLIPLPL